MHRLTRRDFLAAALAAPAAAYLTSCGYPADLDPIVYWDQTPAQAAEGARLHARDLGAGGAYASVQPTGSMRPLIDDYDWIVWNTAVPYAALKAGQVILYVPGWNPALVVCHRLREKDSYGWIVSGDNVKPDIDPATGWNRVSEASYRVTPANYRGLVIAVYTTRRNPND